MAPTNSDNLRIFPSRPRAPQPAPSKRTTFYREELVKHGRCLERQREFYSEKAITDVKAALNRLNVEMDELCERENGDQLVSRLLKRIDGVTRLSAWSDPKKHH